nr:Protein kinase, AMP-activated, beta [Polyrhizophydium stewartii]
MMVTSPSLLEPGTYVTVFDYVPQQPNELEVRLGDMVQVHLTFHDGWCLGENYQTGAKGMVPLFSLVKLAPELEQEMLAKMRRTNELLAAIASAAAAKAAKDREQQPAKSLVSEQQDGGYMSGIDDSPPPTAAPARPVSSPRKADSGAEDLWAERPPTFTLKPNQASDGLAEDVTTYVVSMRDLRRVSIEYIPHALEKRGWDVGGRVSAVAAAAPTSFFFVWRLPAEKVSISGTFNDWKRQVPMFFDHGSNMYTAFVEGEGLQHGDICEYKYLVDGRWLCDEDLPVVIDETGHKNNFLVVCTHFAYGRYIYIDIFPVALAQDAMRRLVSKTVPPAPSSWSERLLDVFDPTDMLAETAKALEAHALAGMPDPEEPADVDASEDIFADAAEALTDGSAQEPAKAAVEVVLEQASQFSMHVETPRQIVVHEPAAPLVARRVPHMVVGVEVYIGASLPRRALHVDAAVPLRAAWLPHWIQASATTVSIAPTSTVVEEMPAKPLAAETIAAAATEPVTPVEPVESTISGAALSAEPEVHRRSTVSAASDRSGLSAEGTSADKTDALDADIKKDSAVFVDSASEHGSQNGAPRLGDRDREFEHRRQPSKQGLAGEPTSPASGTLAAKCDAPLRLSGVIGHADAGRGADWDRVALVPISAGGFESEASVLSPQPASPAASDTVSESMSATLDQFEDAGDDATTLDDSADAEVFVDAAEPPSDAEAWFDPTEYFDNDDDMQAARGRQAPLPLVTEWLMVYELFFGHYLSFDALPLLRAATMWLVYLQFGVYAWHAIAKVLEALDLVVLPVLALLGHTPTSTVSSSLNAAGADARMANPAASAAAAAAALASELFSLKSAATWAAVFSWAQDLAVLAYAYMAIAALVYSVDRHWSRRGAFLASTRATHAYDSTTPGSSLAPPRKPAAAAREVLPGSAAVAVGIKRHVYEPNSEFPRPPASLPTRPKLSVANHEPIEAADSDGWRTPVRTAPSRPSFPSPPLTSHPISSTSMGSSYSFATHTFSHPAGPSRGL